MLRASQPRTVTLCHKPGTPAQQTKLIPQTDVNDHLGHGDYLGVCSDDDTVCTGCEPYYHGYFGANDDCYLCTEQFGYGCSGQPSVCMLLCMDGDGDGYGIGGSFELNENWFIGASYSKADFDFGVDLTQLSLGAGYHVPLTDNTDFYGTLAFVRAEVSASGFPSVDDDGYHPERVAFEMASRYRHARLIQPDVLPAGPLLQQR